MSYYGKGEKWNWEQENTIKNDSIESNVITQEIVFKNPIQTTRKEYYYPDGKKVKKMNNNIDKCPFCGGNAKLTETKELVGHGCNIPCYQVVCNACGAMSCKDSIYNHGVEATIKMVVDNWNKRVKNDK